MPGPIDIHTHWCLFGRDPLEVLAELRWLESKGGDKVAVYPLLGMGASSDKVWNMVPGAYRELVGLTTERAANDDVKSWGAFKALWLEEPHSLELLSFLDIRVWDGKANLSPWLDEGHAGLKGILIEDEDEAKMQMRPLRHASGVSRTEYFAAQRKVFDTASRLDLPLVYHADLSLHRGFIEECLQEHPGLRVNIPHLGFSRKHIARLFEMFPLLQTDISSLGPYIKADPAAYRDFAVSFPDRIMLGSDVIASHDMRLSMDYIGHVEAMGLPADVEKAVLYGNALRFLGRSH